MKTSQEVLDIAILCITYNHAKYIRKTLDGFLMQQTEYKYKAFIHDDASTDGTQEILREYEKKYPDLLKVIYEEENQYSKGTDIIGLMRQYIDSARYVAWCEGDDFWFYPHKLQKQCEFMDSHPDTTLCVHNGINWDESADKQYCLINELETGYLSFEESVWFIKGHFPTCSFFFRPQMLNYSSIGENQPPVADDPIMYYSANNGQVYYMDKVWAVRNYMHPGSWNANVASDVTKKINHFVKYADYLKDLYYYSNKVIKPYIMDMIMGLLGYGIRYFICSDQYSFDELRKGTEKLKDASMHHYDDLCQKCMIEMTKSCVDYTQIIDKVLSDNSNRAGIYIYGAGEAAAKLYKIVDRLGYAVEGFIVSKKSNEKEYMSHKVISIDEFDIDNPSSTILIGLGRRNADEVIDFLREKNIKSRIIYNGNEIHL